MPKAGKKYEKAAAARELKPYSLDEAVALVKKIAYAKFNETVEVSMRLGVDPKHADQMVRGTVVLPNGLGKSKKVVVIASGEKVKEARDNGADEVGGGNVDIVEEDLLGNPRPPGHLLAGRVGQIDVLQQEGGTERLQVLLRHVGDQEGHSLPLLRRRRLQGLHQFLAVRAGAALAAA